MYEFETFTYLDVPKTGSTFISSYLRKFCVENLVRFKKHAPVGTSYDPSKFYFISSRDPLDQYISLFSYGCSGEGNVYSRLAARGYGHLYENSEAGFLRWLEFVLRPTSGAFLKPGYHGRIAELIGFQSFRFLNLAFCRARQSFRKCGDGEALIAEYRAANIAKKIVRYECFRDDLAEVTKANLRCAVVSLDAALEHLANATAVNPSNRVLSIQVAKLDPEIMATLYKREWFLYTEVRSGSQATAEVSAA